MKNYNEKKCEKNMVVNLKTLCPDRNFATGKSI